MTQPTIIKALSIKFSMSLLRLILRYVVGIAVGLIPLASIRLLVEIFVGRDTFVYIEIISVIFLLAIPGILVWHILNEAIWLLKFEMKYREHITAFCVASVLVIMCAVFAKLSRLGYVELSILICLFVFSAILTSFLYVILCRRLMPNFSSLQK